MYEESDMAENRKEGAVSFIKNRGFFVFCPERDFLGRNGLNPWWQ